MATEKKDRTRIPCVINASIGALVWTFPTMGQVTLHLDRVSDANKQRFIPHGAKQKCADAMALDADDFGGRVPESAKHAALKSIVDWFETGTNDWTRRGEPRQTGDRTILRLVLERLNRKLKVAIEDLDGKQVAAILARPDFKPTADAIRAEQIGDVDTDDLLDDFEA